MTIDLNAIGITLNINDKLRELYSSHFSELKIFAEKFPNENLQGPLMVKVDGYINQPLKLMFVGQETFGWCQSISIEDQIGTYEDFNFGSEYRSTPFWNVIRKVESALSVDAYSIAWSNLNRFDQNVGAPVGEVLKQISQFDQILKEEIKILSPDVCFLFTNHKYDSRLNDMYEGLIFEDIDGLPEHHFARLLHPNLPKITIRAPHPKTIRVNYWEEMFMKFVETLS